MLKPKLPSYNSVEDFVADEDFQNYCISGVDERRWTRYRNKHPYQVEMMDEATMFVKILSPNTSPQIKPRKKNSIISWKFAAVVLPFMLALGGWLLLDRNNVEAPIISHIAQDQNVSILLSDLSKINLREGGNVEFKQHWNSKEVKEVWLNGEAYFDVEKSENKGQHFVVHLINGSVNVLGTKFVAKGDSLSTTIILEEGKINFELNGATYEMYPGDMLKSTSNGVQVLHDHDVRTFDSWRSSKLSFTNRSIENVIATLNRSYGYNISIGNPALKERKITATVNRNDPMLLLQAIAEIYDIKVVKKSNQIILK